MTEIPFTIRSFDSGEGGDEACVAHAWGDARGFKGKVRRSLLPATAFGPDRMTAEDRLRGFLQAEIDREKAREANGQMAAERMRQRRAATAAEPA